MRSRILLGALSAAVVIVVASAIFLLAPPDVDESVVRLKPGDLITRKSLENGIAAAVATGDETGPRSWEIRSSVVASQVQIHREWGGVVPELASRQHVRDICGVTERALRDGGVSWDQLDGVAVTQRDRRRAQQY